MPGMNASLSDTAFAIWERIPVRCASRGEDGRSAWLSSVFIEHAGWVERYNKLLDEKLELDKALRIWERAYE